MEMLRELELVLPVRLELTEPKVLALLALLVLLLELD